VTMVPIRDGPAEGLETSAGPKFVWLEVVARKRSERTPNTGLYELRDGAYEYIGGRTSRCDGCGAYYERAEGGAEKQPCPLCGEGQAAA
jgi:hypothetical protein